MEKNVTPKVVTKKHMARLERERLQNRYIMISAAVVLVLVFGLIAFGLLDQNVLVYNRAVAKVNDQTITVGEFEDQARITRQQLIVQYQQYMQFAQLFGDTSGAQQILAQLQDNNSVGRSAMDYLIESALVRQEAEERGITVTAAEVDDRMQDWFGYYPDGTPTTNPTVTVWPTSTLSAQQQTLVPPTATPTTPPTPTSDPNSTAAPTTAPTEAGTPTVDPNATLAPTATPRPSATPVDEAGYRSRVDDALKPFEGRRVDEADLRRLVETSLYNEKLQQMLTADLEQNQEMVWARHILVQTEAEALSIIEQLKNGADFAELAKEFSIDTSNKDAGGDLNWFYRGQMVPEFETVAYQLEVGQVSDPVETQFGWHVIQVLGHEVRQLSDDQFNQLKSTTFQKWLDETKQAAKIEEYPEVWGDRVPEDPTIPVPEEVPAG